MEKVEKKSSGWKYVLGIVIAIIVSFMLGAGALFGFFYYNPDIFKTTITNITKTEKEVTVNENGIADAVEKVYDSVVVVETYRNNKLSSTGTGFFYKKEGNKYYLLTNQHVTDGGTSWKVVLTNGKSKTVKIEGSDVYADIAVLSFEVEDANSEDYPIVEIGSTNDMKVGDTLFAIGAPLDSTIFSGTVTRGILSGKDRLIERSTSNSYTADWIVKVIQTDTAINSGNSGGPLCNSNGQVIGINNMKLKITGVEGMGFAIPIDDAISYAEQLLKDGKIVRPYIGLSLDNANNAYYASYFDYDDDLIGVVVTKVVSDSPADKAGLKVGDVITEVNGTSVKDLASFKYYLYKYKPGDTVKIKYVRGTDEKETSIHLTNNEN